MLGVGVRERQVSAVSSAGAVRGGAMGSVLGPAEPEVPRATRLSVVGMGGRCERLCVLCTCDTVLDS